MSAPEQRAGGAPEPQPGDAREAILARIRAATADVPAFEPPAWDPARDAGADAAYARERQEPLADRLARFAARVREHGGRVAEVDDAPDALAAAVAEACARRRIGSLLVPADLPAAWLPAGVRRVPDEPPLDHAAVSAAEAVLTASALAIADTGTIALDGGPAQGRRALTLLPDVHLCVVCAEQVVGDVPAAVAQLAGAARAGRQLTLVSGPSATSDIAFQRVVGVHGPRTLEVLLVRGGAAATPRGDAGA